MSKIRLSVGREGTDFVWLAFICSPDLETHFSTLLKNLTDAFAVCACGGRTHECAISQLGAWVKRQRTRRATLELAQNTANNSLPLPYTAPTNPQDPQDPQVGSSIGADSGLSGLHPSHYHHPEPTLPIHPAHISVGAAVMGSAGFGVATGGDVSEEEDESLGMVPGPGAPPRRSFARKSGQVVGETQEGVVRGLWEKEGGYVFPRPQLGREGDGFVVRGGEETESDGDRPETRRTPRPAGALQAPIELDQEQVVMPLPGETPADALRRIKGIDLGVLVGSSRGVKVLKPEHGGMLGVQIDERWGHVRSGDVRNRGQQVQRRPSIATVGADADESLLSREKRKRVDEEEGPVRKRARKDVEMAIVEQVEVIQDERCETCMPPRARKGWKSFCQRFGQRGACLPCSIVNSATEYTFVGAVPQRSLPRRSPERMEVDGPLPVPVQPQLHHQHQPPSQPLQQFVVVSPQLPAEQPRPAQPHSRPQSQRPAFTSLPSSSSTHNTYGQSTEAPTPRSEILSSALYTPGPPREQLERNHQYPFPNASLSNAHSNGTKLIHPTPHHMQTAQVTPQVLQMEERELSPSPVVRKISGPPQVPQLVHGRGGSVSHVSIPRPAVPVSVDLLGLVIRIDTALQTPAIQSRSRGGMSLAGMLNSPVQSMRPLPSTSTPAAVPAPLSVQQPMSSAFIPPARESSCSGYAFDSTRASMSTGRDSILSSGPPRPRTESTSTVGPSIQNGPMSAGLYLLQPLPSQRIISVGSPPPNASHSRPYSHRPQSVGPHGVLHPHSPPHPPPQHIHAQPIVVRQHPLVVRPRTASSPVPLQAVPQPSRASITPAPPPTLLSRPTGTRSLSTHLLDPQSVLQVPLEVKMEIVEGLLMKEDTEEPQVHTYSPAAFQVPPSSNSSAMVTPVMVDAPPEPFLIRHKEPSVPTQEAIRPVPVHADPTHEVSDVPVSCPSPVIPALRQVSVALSVASQAPTVTPDPIAGLRQPSTSPASRQQSVAPAPAPRQASVAPVLFQPIVASLSSLPAQGQTPVPQRQRSLVPEPFVTVSPAPVSRSPSPQLGDVTGDVSLVPPLSGQTPEPPTTQNPEPEEAVRPLTFVTMVPQPRQSLLDDIWSDQAVVVRPESSSSSGMRPPLQSKHPTEKLKVEIPRQDVKMISPASSSPLSSPPDEHDEHGSSEVESDEESDEDDDRNEDESMTGSNDEESSEDPFAQIRRGKSTTTVESPLSNSSPPRRLSIAGTRTVRNVVLESPEEGEVHVDDDHSSPPPPLRPSTIRTTPSISTPKHDNLMELDEQSPAEILPTANRPSTPPKPLEPPKPSTTTEPPPTPTVVTAIAPKSMALEEAPTRVARQPSPPKAPPVRRIPFSEYKNRKREQGIQPKMVSLPEITGGSIAPLLGLAATPVQTPTTTTSSLSGTYSSVLSTPSAMSGLGPFMTGSSTTPIGEANPVLPKKDNPASLTRFSAGDPTSPSLISPSVAMPAPTPALSHVNSGLSSQISGDPRLRPTSPVATLVIPMKPNGHSSMAPAVVPAVPPVQPTPTAPLRASTAVLRRTPPTGPKADRERRLPNSPRTTPVAPTVLTSARPPPKLVPPTTKEDGEIDPSRPSSPLATPIPRQGPRGWEEAPKQPRAFKLNGPNATGSASPASPAVSRDGHSSGPSRANAGWRGGRGGHPPTGPRALRENGPSRSNTVGGGYGPRGPHDRDWDPDRDRDAGWRERDRRDRDRDREWDRERRRR